MAQIGDLLIKDPNTLTPQEREELRLWGNQTQLSNNYVAGLQNGGSVVLALELRADRIFAGKDMLSGRALRTVAPAVSISNNPSPAPAVSGWVDTYNDGFVIDGSKVYIPETGIYTVFIITEWVTNGTGTRAITLQINGTTISLPGDSQVPSSTVSTPCQGVDENSFTKGDYLEILNYQNSGGSLSTIYTALVLRKVR